MFRNFFFAKVAGRCEAPTRKERCEAATRRNTKNSTHRCRGDWVLRYESVGLLCENKPVLNPPFDFG